MCVSRVCLCMLLMFECLQMPEESSGWPRAGVTGTGEPPRESGRS